MIFSEEDRSQLQQVCPEGLRILSARSLRGSLNPGLPLALQWSWSRELAGLIEQEHRAEPFDAAVVSHSYAFEYSDPLAGVPRIIDAQNIESRLYHQFARLSRGERSLNRRLAGRAGLGFLGAAHTARAIAAVEERAWRQASAILSVSHEELHRIAALVGPDRTLYAPNCPSEAMPSPDHPAGADGRVRTVSFASSLDYMPNIDAVVLLVDQIAPRVWSMVPEAKLVVAGRRPTRRLVRFCTRAGVEVVPEPPNMADVIRGSVFASPIRLVAGTRMKILDARAAHLPVVTTSLALEGLDLADDPGIAVHDDWDGFSRSLVDFLDRRPVMSRPARGPSWSDSFRPLAEALERLL